LSFSALTTISSAINNSKSTTESSSGTTLMAMPDSRSEPNLHRTTTQLIKNTLHRPDRNVWIVCWQVIHLLECFKPPVVGLELTLIFTLFVQYFQFCRHWRFLGEDAFTHEISVSEFQCSNTNILFPSILFSLFWHT
jgi:hypothetical protein